MYQEDTLSEFKRKTNLVFFLTFHDLISMKDLSSKMGVIQDFDVQIIEQKDLCLFEILSLKQILKRTTDGKL